MVSADHASNNWSQYLTVLLSVFCFFTQFVILENLSVLDFAQSGDKGIKYELLKRSVYRFSNKKVSSVCLSCVPV